MYIYMYIYIYIYIYKRALEINLAEGAPACSAAKREGKRDLFRKREGGSFDGLTRRTVIHYVFNQ